MLKVRFWWRGAPILCRLVPYLRGMGPVYGATTPPLFRCRRRGGKFDGGGGAEAAHGAAFTQSSNPRPGVRGRRATDDSQCSRHRADRRGSGVSRPCPTGAGSGRCGSRSGTTRCPARQIVVRAGLPDRKGDRLAPRSDPASSRGTPQYRDHRLEPVFSRPRGCSCQGQARRGVPRREARATDLMFTVVATEPFVVVLPSDHRLASYEAINPHDLVGETFIAVSNTAPVGRKVVDDYLRRSGIDIKPDHEADHLAMAMSLVASTRGVALLPAYARNLLPSSLISRPLQGDVPTIDLVVGYSKTNTSPILKLFLSRIDDLIARVSKKTH